ncbi:MAG TPA: hypothetical protein VFA59_15110, partial [Vicinamibacterales bacterium]|nr:hypothetical protein [Vicinamibacterales bacterium]
PDASRWLSDQLRARRDSGTAVVVSSHRIHDLADVCDRCDFLVGGSLTATVTCQRESTTGERVEQLLDAFDRASGRCVTEARA